MRDADGNVEQEDLLSHLYRVLHSDMPSCGCGDPGAADRLVIGLLTVFAGRGDGRSRRVGELIGGTDGAQQIVLASLDHAGLIDHGTSVWGSWLTERGKWVLWAVEQVGGVDGLDEKLDEVGFPHEWDSETKAMQPCTDDCWRVPEGSAA
ncbi:hypothetical protein OG824_31860 [Streptomyces prunicolor]|uniref:hypothetical protein n=1 Tax=Streptomyces prunicolor TaxID=67348 RepID=UPI00224CDEF1|nr:hypothetical protein [Streptomyces prunicolor]MCX5239807.1 hypothetical protein [Streptomyces prunicolor]